MRRLKFYRRTCQFMEAYEIAHAWHMEPVPLGSAIDVNIHYFWI